jgi:hypothetical protein
MRTAHGCLRVREMAKRKLSPGEIVERLRAIDALTADGQPVAVALRVAGVLPVEYDQWRSEYAGLLRTLGPLASAPPKVMKKTRRAGRGRPVGTVK